MRIEKVDSQERCAVVDEGSERCDEPTSFQAVSEAVAPFFICARHIKRSRRKLSSRN